MWRLSGRIIRVGEALFPVGDVVLGGLSHIARVILTCMQADAGIRATLNVKFKEDFIKTAEKAGLKCSFFDRTKQPKESPTMDWGTKEAIEKVGFVPDAIYDKGDVGKEAMIRIVGTTPSDVIEKLGIILSLLRLRLCRRR